MSESEAYNIEPTKDPEFAVEAILDKRLYRGAIQYKVKWLDYRLEKATWEPMEGLYKCLPLLAKFEAKFHARMMGRLGERKLKLKKKRVVMFEGVRIKDLSHVKPSSSKKGNQSGLTKRKNVEQTNENKKKRQSEGVFQGPGSGKEQSLEVKKGAKSNSYSGTDKSKLGRKDLHSYDQKALNSSSKNSKHKEKSQFQGEKKINKREPSSKKNVKDWSLSPIYPLTTTTKKKLPKRGLGTHNAGQKNRPKIRDNISYSADDESELGLKVKHSSSKKIMKRQNKENSNKNGKKPQPQKKESVSKKKFKEWPLSPLNQNTRDTKVSAPAMAEKRSLKRSNQQDMDQPKKRKYEKSPRQMEQLSEEMKDVADQKSSSIRDSSPSPEWSPITPRVSPVEPELMDHFMDDGETAEVELGASSQDPEEMVLHQFY